MRVAASACLLDSRDGSAMLAIARAAAGPVQKLIDAVLAVGAPGQDNVTVIKLEREK